MSDLISRKWLMECVDEGWIKFDTEKDKNIYVHLVRDIAPSAQPEPEWIPCSEKLPEENMTRVLTTVKTPHKGLNARSGTYYDGLFMNDNGDVWKTTAKELKAWMPLPNPWKGGKQDE